MRVRITEYIMKYIEYMNSISNVNLGIGVHHGTG